MSNISIGRQIAEISNLIKRRIQSHTQYDECSQLSHTSACILAYLHDHLGDVVFQRDLEHEFNVRRSTMSKTLSLLEQKGYITREDVDSDKRLKKIALTQKACQFSDKIILQRERLEKTISQSLTQEELVSFYNICEKIKQNLLEEVNQ